MCSVDFAPFSATMAVFAEKAEEKTYPFPHILLTELSQAHNVDEILGVWMTAMRKRECPILKRTPNPAKHGIMKKNWQKFCFYRGLLHRKVVLPTKYIPTVYKALHDDMGHQGYEKTLGLIRSRFFWSRISKGGLTTVVAV